MRKDWPINLSLIDAPKMSTCARARHRVPVARYVFRAPEGIESNISGRVALKSSQGSRLNLYVFEMQRHVVAQGTTATRARRARTWCCRARPTRRSAPPTWTPRAARSRRCPPWRRPARRARTGRSCGQCLPGGAILHLQWDWIRFHFYIRKRRRKAA